MLILNANRNLSRTDRQLEGQAEGHTRVKQYIPSPSEWGIIIQSAYSSVFINWRCAVILCGHDVKINELTCSGKNCMSKTVVKRHKSNKCEVLQSCCLAIVCKLCSIVQNNALIIPQNCAGGHHAACIQIVTTVLYFITKFLPILNKR